VLGGWNVRRRLAWLVAVLISVAAALSSLLEADALSTAEEFPAGVAEQNQASFEAGG
jgi:hypothetical protein